MFESEESYRQWFSEQDEVCGFENPTYWQAIEGMSTDGALVYDYDKMVEVLMLEEDMSEEDAIDWMDYNVLRTIPYMHPSPVIVNFYEDLI